MKISLNNQNNWNMKKLVIAILVALALMLWFNCKAFSQQIYQVGKAKVDSAGWYKVTKVVKRGGYWLVKLDNVKGWFRVHKKHPVKKDEAIYISMTPFNKNN